MLEKHFIKLKKDIEDFLRWNKNFKSFPQFGIGIDVEEISRFKAYSLNHNNSFLQKLYSKKELEYCFSKKDPSPHLAVRFCAKEAIYKAINDMMPLNLNFKSIEILNDENGRPRAYLHDEGKSKWKIKISLSHSKKNAMAIAVAILNTNNHFNSI